MIKKDKKMDDQSLFCFSHSANCPKTTNQGQIFITERRKRDPSSFDPPLSLPSADRDHLRAYATARCALRVIAVGVLRCFSPNSPVATKISL
jgi:hypothetical protein